MRRVSGWPRVAAGLLALTLLSGAQQGPNLRSSTEKAGAENQAERRAPEVAPAPANPVSVVNNPFVDAPCQYNQDNRQSDLCAQWKAADAARDAANWALVGTFVAAIGMVGLFTQIRLTRKALQETSAATAMMQDANRIARDAHQATVDAAHLATRPWVTIEALSFLGGYNFPVARDWNQRPIEAVSQSNMSFSVELRNRGDIPALNVKVLFDLLPAGILPRDGVPVVDHHTRYWRQVDTLLPAEEHNSEFELSGIVQDILWNDWGFWLIAYCTYTSPASEKELETVRSWRIYQSKVDPKTMTGHQFTNETLPGKGTFTGETCYPHTVRMT